MKMVLVMETDFAIKKTVCVNASVDGKVKIAIHQDVTKTAAITDNVLEMTFQEHACMKSLCFI